MSSLLLVGFASHWAGKAVPCQFQAWGDGNPLPLSGVSTAAAPFELDLCFLGGLGFVSRLLVLTLVTVVRSTWPA